ncbi:MAG TPA: diguanylate cyclase [Solirubrobacteraceae bacterium]|jgi:diguanylate cyclase (GGDEF)-like protein|nr:diguanylate cyclase [Solirubrobacteraceae bacterium]
MARTSWLTPTELDRSRVVDANARVRMIRTIGSGAVGIALLAAAPWVGWWTLLLFGFSLLNFLNVERRIHKSAHPERVSAFAIVLTMLLIGGGIALSGGPRSVALQWMALPAAMVAARFRPQVVIAALGLAIAIVLAATFGTHPQWTLQDPAPLLATLALLVGVVSIVWALQAAELHHRDEAIIDPLTGLLNRHALIPRFAELSHQARLTRQPVCLLLCDIDNFKAINDEHGHGRGDAVLCDTAYALRKRLHSFELVYRLGGEEFLVVLPGADVEVGREVAERLRHAVEHACPAGVATTVSIGVSAASGQHAEYESLFKAADEALYAAKHAGRNRVMSAGREGSGEGENAGEGEYRAHQAALETLERPYLAEPSRAVA